MTDLLLLRSRCDFVGLLAIVALLPSVGCSQPTLLNSAAVRLCNIWALKVGTVKGEFGMDSWMTTVVARQDDAHEVLLARFLATSVFPEALSKDVSQLGGVLPSVLGKRIRVKIAVGQALLDAGVYSDLTMARLSAESHVLNLERGSLTILMEKGNPAALDIPSGLAQELVKVELLLNRALTPALAKEIAATEAGIWTEASEDTRVAIGKFGDSLPTSLNANQGAAAFVAKLSRLLQAATNAELRESRSRVRAVFEDTLKANPDLVKNLGSTGTSLKKQ